MITFFFVQNEIIYLNLILWLIGLIKIPVCYYQALNQFCKACISKKKKIKPSLYVLSNNFMFSVQNIADTKYVSFEINVFIWYLFCSMHLYIW